MVNYIKYKGKFWKIVSNRNGRYYLIPKTVNAKFKKRFRSYKNLSRYGYSKNFRGVIRNQTKRNKLKGGQLPNIRETVVDDYNPKQVPFTEKDQYITKNDREWVNNLGNPRDKVIADKSLNQLNNINKLLKFFGGNTENFRTVSDAAEYLKRNKQQVLENMIANNAEVRSLGENLKEVFKGLGQKILNFIGVNINPKEYDFTASNYEKQSKALDEIINDLKNKALTSQQTLQQIYLKQGDREEAKAIRDEEEAKQEKIRKEDRVLSTPKYQIVRNLNPLGFGVSESRINVDTENKEQVREVRQNPVLKRIDPNYLPRTSQNKVMAPTPASTTNPFQRREQSQSSWQ